MQIKSISGTNFRISSGLYVLQPPPLRRIDFGDDFFIIFVNSLILLYVDVKPPIPIKSQSSLLISSSII